MIYESLEPFGEERADVRSAIIAKTIADVNTPKGKKRIPLEAFMPRFERQTQTVEQQLSLVEMFNTAFGGKDLRGNTDDNDGQAGA